MLVTHGTYIHNKVHQLPNSCFHSSNRQSTSSPISELQVAVHSLVLVIDMVVRGKSVLRTTVANRVTGMKGGMERRGRGRGRVWFSKGPPGRRRCGGNHRSTTRSSYVPSIPSCSLVRVRLIMLLEQSLRVKKRGWERDLERDGSTGIQNSRGHHRAYIQLTAYHCRTSMYKYVQVLRRSPLTSGSSKINVCRRVV